MLIYSWGSWFRELLVRKVLWFFPGEAFPNDIFGSKRHGPFKKSKGYEFFNG
jgi:hypothetical protein